MRKRLLAAALVFIMVMSILPVQTAAYEVLEDGTEVEFVIPTPILTWEEGAGATLVATYDIDAIMEKCDDARVLIELYKDGELLFEQWYTTGDYRAENETSVVLGQEMYETGTYTAKVRVDGTKDHQLVGMSEYATSEPYYFTKPLKSLDTPQNLQITDRILTWEADNNRFNQEFNPDGEYSDAYVGSYYLDCELYENGKKKAGYGTAFYLDKNEYNLNELFAKHPNAPSGTYTISLRAASNLTGMNRDEGTRIGHSDYAKIEYYYDNGSGDTPSIPLTINHSSASLTVGDTLELSVSGGDSTAKTVWTSSNEKVVSVNNGMITGVAPGTATVTATKGNGTAKCRVVIREKYDLITDEMLFNDYPMYLNNELFNNIESKTMELTGNALSEYSGANQFWSLYKYCLSNGGIDIIMDYCFNKEGYVTETMKKDICRDIAIELLNSITTQDLSKLESISDNLSEQLKDLGAVTSITSARLNEIKENYKNIYRASFTNLTEKQINKAVDEVIKKTTSSHIDLIEDIGSVLKAGGMGINVYQYIGLMITMSGTEISIFDDLISTLPDDSPIRKELTQLKKERLAYDERSFESGLYLLRDVFSPSMADVANKLIKETAKKLNAPSFLGILDYSGLCILTGEMTTELIAHFIPAVTVEDFLKTQYLYTAVVDSSITLMNMRANIIKKGATADEIYLYKKIYSNYLLLQRKTLESAEKSTKNQIIVASIRPWLSLHEDLSVETYIKTCKREVAQNGNLKYKIENGKVTLLGVNKTKQGNKTLLRAIPETALAADNISAVMYIPKEIEGYPVTSIAEEAFNGDSDMQVLIFKSDVDEIGKNAFSDCDNLSTVIFMGSLEEIGESAFEGCRSLTDMTLPTGTQCIGEKAFKDCSGLAQVDIPASVNSVSADSFVGTSPDLVIHSDGNDDVKTMIEEAGLTYVSTPSKAAKIEITKLPDKKRYNIDEDFDATGMVVKATFENGQTKEVTDYEVVFNSSTKGAYKAVVCYEDQYATFDVNIIDKNGGSSSGGSTVAKPEDKKPEETVKKASEIFVDVEAGSWYEEAVTFAVEKGLFKGVDETHFAPAVATTRAMIMTVLARLDGHKADTYDEAVAWATDNGVSDGSDINAVITREQFVTMLYRYAEQPEASGELTGFTDMTEVSDWAWVAMSWAVDNGIIKGNEQSELSPKAAATRAEAAAIMQRYITLIEK